MQPSAGVPRSRAHAGIHPPAQGTSTPWAGEACFWESSEGVIMKAAIVVIVCALTVYGAYLTVQTATRVINARTVVIVSGAQ
jgi:hypothetical protein